MSDAPLVSVIMPSYNHAAFIKQAISSVLEQTYTHLELIITDDGSSDNSIEIIKTFTDPRIKLFIFEKNRGACLTTNHCIENAKGEYIAVINSDDVWHPDKLQLQLEVFKQKPELGAVFTFARFVNENIENFSRSERPVFFKIFELENCTRGEWLHRLFFVGNCLCHPSVLIKKQCYEEAGMYNNKFRQLPDYDMWIRLIKKYDIFVMNKELVYFRLLPGERNASALNVANKIRGSNEAYLILYNFFDGISKHDFKEGFSKVLKNPNFNSDEEFEIEKALVYIKSPTITLYREAYQLIGIQKLFSLLNDPRFSRILSLNYGYDDKAFQYLLSQMPIFIKPLKEKNTATNLAGFKVIAMMQEIISRLSNRLILKPARLLFQKFKSIII